VKRRLSRFYEFKRPSSNPYITGDGFRSIAHHIFDDASDVRVSKVKTGDIIFVRSDMLQEFFKKKLPLIKNRFILLSHNADNNIDASVTNLMNSKVIHWFAQNILIKDSKISPLPIGLSNIRYNPDSTFIKIVQSEGFNKKNKIAVSFRPNNPERALLVETILKFNTAEEALAENKLDYYRKISQFKFVASPEGNGVDCHRTWEALYLRSVPIVIRNVMTECFEELGLPVILINNWDELKVMSEDFIEKKYKELEPKFDSEAIYIDYWLKMINYKINLLN
jgi:hypothetical protein